MATNQVETATVLGSVTGSGNATVIVTAARMSNSPKTISVAVLGGDTASDAALKMRQTLALDADVAAFFIVSGSGTNMVLTTETPAANDTTMNISIDNGTCSGLTAAPTSTNTTAGDGISNGYATLAQYKTWIAVRGLTGGVGTDTSDDTVIEILIEAASRYMDRQTGKRFYQNSSDETRYYSSEDEYCVKVDPLVSITSVSVDYSGTRSYTLLAPTDYDLTPDNAALDSHPYTALEIARLVSSAYFPTTRKGIQVVGKFGWPVTPKDVTDATLAIAQSLNASRSGQSSAGKLTVTAAGIVIRPEDVPPFAQDIIQSYRSMV